MDIDTQLRPRRAAHPGDQRTRPPAGRHARRSRSTTGRTSATRTRGTRSSSTTSSTSASVNLQWMKGAHALRFGFEYQNQQINHFQPQGGTFQTARGTFQFNGNSTRLQNGPAPADARFNTLGGLPAGPAERRRQGRAAAQPQLASTCRRTPLYVQDTWQATRDLTVNYGVRWEYYPLPTRGAARRVALRSGGRQRLHGRRSATCRSTRARSAGSGQFLPRLGLAYRLERQDGVARRLRAQRRPEAVHRLPQRVPRSTSPGRIRRCTFNGVTNAFMPVTTLRHGPRRGGGSAAAPDLTQGVIPLPAGRRHHDLPEGGRAEVRPVLERDGPARAVRAASPRRSATSARRVQGQQGFVNINASAPGTGNAGRPLARFGIRDGHQHDQPVRRRELPRAADRAEGRA